MDEWSKGGQIYYLDGMAYGVHSDGSGLCLGRDTAARAIIADTDLSYGIPAYDNIIAMEREILGIKKESVTDARIRIRNTSTPDKRGINVKASCRSGFMLHAGRRAADTGRPAGKGLARRVLKPKQPRLFN